MTLTLVASATVRETVEINGRSFTLRPMTFGEAGAIAQDQAMELAPSAAILAECVREALRVHPDLSEADRERHIWLCTRGGIGGVGPLPEPGGINQQPAWQMGVFAILSSKQAEIEDAESRRA